MTILQMSLSAVFLILIIAIIRSVFINKLPKNTFLLLWSVALCRLLIPFSLPSPFSAYNAAYDISKTSLKTYNLATDVIIRNSQVTAALSKPKNILEASSTFSHLFTAVLIWFIGAILIAAIFVVIHWRSLKEYKTALPVSDCFVEKWLMEHKLKRSTEIRQSDKILSPLTYGIYHPVILLPKIMDYSDQVQLQYILTHEFIHIKRFDTLKKYLLAITLCIHWFNPFVWLMYFLANHDMELSCDEGVVLAFGENIKASYALTLISMEERRSRFSFGSLFNNFSFSKNALEKRIKTIMKIKKTNKVSVLLSIFLILVTSVAFATSAVEAKAVKVTAVGVFDKVMDTDQVLGKSANNIFYLDSIRYEGNNIKAVIGVAGDLSDNFQLTGRIAPYGHPFYETIFNIKGSLKELKRSKNGIRFFQYSASIERPKGNKYASTQDSSAKEYLLGYKNLSDADGDILELTLIQDKSRYEILTTIGKTYTQNVILHADQALQNGNYLDSIVLTPAKLTLIGYSKNKVKTPDDLAALNIHVSILLSGGKKIDKGPSTMNSCGGETGEFSAYWNLKDAKGSELDLDKITALVIDGKVYSISQYPR